MVEGLTQLDSTASQFVKKHRVQLQQIPEPGVEWKIDDVDIHHSRIRELREFGVVRVVRREYDKGDWSKNVYATTDKGYDAIQKWAEKDERTDGFLPCGHDGFRSTEETVICLRSGCEKEFKKSEVR